MKGKRLAARIGMTLHLGLLWSVPANTCALTDVDPVDPDTSRIALDCPVDICAPCRGVVDDGGRVAPYLARPTHPDATRGIAIVNDQNARAYVAPSPYRGSGKRTLHIVWEAGERCTFRASPADRWQRLPPRCVPRVHRFDSHRVHPDHVVTVHARQVGLIVDSAAGLESGGHPQWAPFADTTPFDAHARWLKEESAASSDGDNKMHFRSRRMLQDHVVFTGLARFETITVFENYSDNLGRFMEAPVLALAPLPHGYSRSSRQGDMSWHWRTRADRQLVATFFSGSTQQLFGVTAPTQTPGRYEVVVLATQDQDGARQQSTARVLTTAAIAVRWPAHLATE